MKTSKIFKSLILLVFVGLAISCGSSDGDGDGTTGGTTGGGTTGGGTTGGGVTVTSIEIITNSNELLQGDSASFLVKNNLNLNVSSSATIYVGGTVISGSSYTFTGAGMHDVYAVVDNLTSPTITVNSIEATHTTKVMVEDYTGTWCQYCPRLASALEETVNLNSNVIPVALHNDADMPFPGVGSLESEFDIAGYPSGRINRTIEWNESASQPIGMLDINKPLGLAINSSLSGNTISAEVKVHYDFGDDEENKLVVYLLENGLIYPQVNFYNTDSSSPWYQMGNPIVNFVHDHAARITFTNNLGDAIPSSESNTGSTYITNFSVAVPASVQNTNNLELVAFVVGTDNTVINVQQADLGVNQDFD